MNDDDRERLARSAEARVQAQIQAERQRQAQQREGRARFATSRRYGLEQRYAAKSARMRLTAHHDQGRRTR